MASSSCMSSGVHQCKPIMYTTKINLCFSNRGSSGRRTVHSTKPNQNCGLDQVVQDQVSTWFFYGGLNYDLDHCATIGPLCQWHLIILKYGVGLKEKRVINKFFRDFQLHKIIVVLMISMVRGRVPQSTIMLVHVFIWLSILCFNV